MKPENQDYLALGLGVILSIVTVYGWLNLPDQIAIHFNAAGQPDSTVGKGIGLIIAPAIFTSLYALFRALPSIDPLGDNILEFEEQYRTAVRAVLGFLTYIQIMVVAWNTGYSFSVNQALAPAIAALYYVMGDVIGEARQNWFIGIRTPWTLSSEEVWQKTHERCGPLFKIAAVAALAATVIPDYFIALTVAPALAVSVYAVLYSYREYRKQE